jgi:plastocyanin
MPFSRRWLLSSAGIAVTLLPVTVGAASTAPVAIQDFTFQPSTIAIEEGDTVLWTNLDFTAHNVTGDGFVSNNLGNNATFQHVFVDAGTFAYLCTLHSGMSGTVDVNAAPPPEIPDATWPVLFGVSTVLIGVGAFSLRRRSSVSAVRS